MATRRVPLLALPRRAGHDQVGHGVLRIERQRLPTQSLSARELVIAIASRLAAEDGRQGLDNLLGTDVNWRSGSGVPPRLG